MKLPVAILAGGLATRLKPLTETVPKSLLDVAGKPFAVHQLELLARHGIDRVVFCVGYLGDQIADVLGDGRCWNLHISYVFDGPVQLGTAGALKKALPYLGDAFLILYGDSYLDCDYAGIARTFMASGRLGLMTVFQNANRWGRSNVIFSNGAIRHYDKTNRTADMDHIDYGVGGLRSRALHEYPNNQPLDLMTVYQDLISADELAGIEVSMRFYEIGSMNGLRETEEFLLKKAQRQ